MTHATRKKNLAAGVLSLVSLLLVLLTSTMSEGSYIVITKPTLYAIALAMGGLARVIGELVRNGDREGRNK